MPLLDISQIAAWGASIRRRCGFIGADPPYSSNKVHQVVFSYVEVHGEDLPVGVLAMTEAGVGRVVIYYNRRETRDQQRFGIMHEFGHLVTDLREVRGLERRECRRGRRGDLHDEVEHICDLFAADVLVPLEVLDRYAPGRLFPRDPLASKMFLDEIDRLASRFNVPSSLIVERLQDLALFRRSSFFRR